MSTNLVDVVQVSITQTTYITSFKIAMILQKGIQYAESAVQNEKLNNYEAAATDYLAAAERFIHAGKRK